MKWLLELDHVYVTIWLYVFHDAFGTSKQRVIKIVDEFSAGNQRAYLDLNDLDLCVECRLSFFDWLSMRVAIDRK